MPNYSKDLDFRPLKACNLLSLDLNERFTIIAQFSSPTKLTISLLVIQLLLLATYLLYTFGPQVLERKEFLENSKPDPEISESDLEQEVTSLHLIENLSS